MGQIRDNEGPPPRRIGGPFQGGADPAPEDRMRAGAAPPEFMAPAYETPHYTPGETRVADAPAENWVDRRAPEALRPALRLMRADRPIGTWLLLLPGWQAILLSAAAVEWRGAELVSAGWLMFVWVVIAFAIGSFVMRSAGCVFNDIVDRDIDAQVERTRSRPLPAGQISLRGAVLLLLALCLIGVAILLTFNQFAIWVGFAAALPVAAYPFMKRITWWPQAFLGAAFNWGVLLGWAVMTGALDWPALLLYAHGVAWTIGYDTIYAHQDREDDALIGVKSTARLFGAESSKMILTSYLIALALIASVGIAVKLGWFFWIGFALYAGHLMQQIWRLDIDNPDLCLRLFRSNRDAGLILLAAIALGSL